MVEAELHDGTFLLRGVYGELQADYALRFSVPEGEQVWTIGWGVFGPVDEFAGDGLRVFEFQARSWFDDHLYDFRIWEYDADRAFDDSHSGSKSSPTSSALSKGGSDVALLGGRLLSSYPSETPSN